MRPFGSKRAELERKADIEANAEALTREIKGQKVCVIGGAGSISMRIVTVLGFTRTLVKT